MNTENTEYEEMSSFKDTEDIEEDLNYLEEKEKINDFITKDINNISIESNEDENEVFINSIEEGEVNINMTKKPKKKDYIEHLWELKKNNLIELPKRFNTKNKLQKAKIKDLKELMGIQINEQTNKIINNEKEIIDTYTNDNLKSESEYKEENLNISIDIGATALYNINKILCKLINGVTNEIKDENNNKYVDLNGLDENLEENKEELLNLYSSIYNEYKEDLTPYISPVNLILYYNIQNGLNTMSKNYYERSNGENLSN